MTFSIVIKEADIPDVQLRLLNKAISTEQGKCWEWSGAAYKGGYGRLSVYDKVRPAHRLAFTVFNGPIPDGLHVLHSCDNPKCINPAHLFAGTHQDNMADKCAKGRQSRLENKPHKPPKTGRLPQQKSTTHGTDALYRRGCRCLICKEYKRAISKSFRLRHAATMGRAAGNGTKSEAPN